MTADIVEIGAHERMTVADALALASREAKEYECVLIIAVNAEGKDLVIRSSAMTREEAAWLAKRAELHAHGLLD